MERFSGFTDLRLKHSRIEDIVTTMLAMVVANFAHKHDQPSVAITVCMTVAVANTMSTTVTSQLDHALAPALAQVPQQQWYVAVASKH